MPQQGVCLRWKFGEGFSKKNIELKPGEECHHHSGCTGEPAAGAVVGARGSRPGASGSDSRRSPSPGREPHRQKP